MKKRGQGSTGAAGLVLIIAILIVLYVLFLPPAYRQELLGGPTNNSEAAAGSNASNVLLQEFVGTIQADKQDSVEHSLQSVNLYTKTEDSVLKSRDAAAITKDKPARIILVVDDVKNTNNVMLSFNVVKHSGKLVILLNDEEIFSGELASSPEPIRLENLQKENMIEFKVPSPGIMFWQSSSYDLSEIKITGTVQNLQSQEAVMSFLMQESEASRLQTATLVYFVDCKVAESAPLKVYLNTMLLTSKVPDCGSVDRIQLDPSDLRQGKNEVRFLAEKGSYLIDRISVKTQLTEPIFPIYYFELNSSRFAQVKNNTKEVILSFRFVDDRESKRAILSINGHKSQLDTNEATFTKPLNAYMEEGNNYILIEPLTRMNIQELKIYMQAK